MSEAADQLGWVPEQEIGAVLRIADNVRDTVAAGRAIAHGPTARSNT